MMRKLFLILVCGLLGRAEATEVISLYPKGYLQDEIGKEPVKLVLPEGITKDTITGRQLNDLARKQFMDNLKLIFNNQIIENTDWPIKGFWNASKPVSMYTVGPDAMLRYKRDQALLKYREAVGKLIQDVLNNANLELQVGVFEELTKTANSISTTSE